MRSTFCISVIICTHNPRPDYFRRVLEALQIQTLKVSEWELLIIDNFSSTLLEDSFDVSWHPSARIIREDELGLTHARLRGIKESQAPLLVFVDDDNVLSQDYLEQVIVIASKWPMIGAFSGSNSGEFEVPPSPEVLPYVGGLAVFELDRDYWTNIPLWSHACPMGAGMCIQRKVAETYAANIASNPLRCKLGRIGAVLNAGDDTDMAFLACDEGLGMGRFKVLKLIHLIPKVRLKPDYIVRLYAGFAFSEAMLGYIRNKQIPTSSKWDFMKDFARVTLGRFRGTGHSPIQRRITHARRRARSLALKIINEQLL